jgi:rRNA maturation protein Rpf1
MVTNSISFEEEKQKLIEASEILPKVWNNTANEEDFLRFVDILDELNVVDKIKLVQDISRQTQGDINSLDNYFKVHQDKKYSNLDSQIIGTLTGATQSAQFSFIERNIINRKRKAQ